MIIKALIPTTASYVDEDNVPHPGDANEAG